MKTYKITKANEHIGISINTLKMLANNCKTRYFNTSGGYRRFRQDNLGGANINENSKGIDWNIRKKGIMRVKIISELPLGCDWCSDIRESLCNT